MNRKQVSSSQIKSIGHDPDTQTMEIEFNSGAVHQYEGVNERQHAAMMAAPSIGSHFHKYVKTRHRSKKLG